MRKFILGITCLVILESSPAPSRKKIKLDTDAIDRESFPFGTTMLMQAACNDNADQIKNILDRGAHIDVEGTFMKWTALTWAAACGSEKAAEILIERGANIHHTDEEGRNPLEVAKIEGQQEMVALLAKDCQSGDESSDEY